MRLFPERSRAPVLPFSRPLPSLSAFRLVVPTSAPPRTYTGLTHKETISMSSQLPSSHILGFPSIGGQRELKKALEARWKGACSDRELLCTAEELKKANWQIQKEAGLDVVTTGDFSLYDRMLDTTLMLGFVPARFAPCLEDGELDLYFALARGDVSRNIAALEMTKWFDTNYHYLVPEIAPDNVARVVEHPVLEDTRLAVSLGHKVKPALIGPFTWLALAKGENAGWHNLDDVVARYVPVLEELAGMSELVQLEEPVLCTELLPEEAKRRFTDVYERLARACADKLLLATCFGPLADNLVLAAFSGCRVLHVDLCRGEAQLDEVLKSVPSTVALSLGLVDGRNIWKCRLAPAVEKVKKAATALGKDRVLVSTSCSLLHCPVDLDAEDALPEHIRSRMAFAVQKTREVARIPELARGGHEEEIAENARILAEAERHPDIVNDEVRTRARSVAKEDLSRKNPYEVRARAQKWLGLPLLPTTTIGSFPQTAEIRRARLDFRKGILSEEEYVAAMRKEIAHVIEQQERLGLDVLVHGEAERNDMVEYFGQQLAGFCFTQNGWVQSYGSRCVKPPVIYGDVSRPKAMTVDWISYAQSLTKKPVKGMLTGPVTILCWSFVRDDLPRTEVCRQIALAIRDEVLDLERAGVGVIQIDEAALREGMPLTKAEAQVYLAWAVEAFRLASSGVKDETQIHTHMCYSEFNAILDWIAKMDADVISIESSRSGMELLDAFTRFNYEAEVGPGVYDIHSPRVPTTEEMAGLLLRALKFIAKEKLWVNPDCGLKTRQWVEAYPSLQNMVEAARIVREELN